MKLFTCLEAKPWQNLSFEMGTECLVVLMTDIYICFPTEKKGDRLLHIFMRFPILVVPVRKQCTDDNSKKSHSWVKYLSTIWKGTAIACQCWDFMCLCMLCHRHWHPVSSRWRFPVEMPWSWGNFAQVIALSECLVLMWECESRHDLYYGLTPALSFHPAGPF